MCYVCVVSTIIIKDGFCFEVIYVDDPKCNLPSSLSSWASSSGCVIIIVCIIWNAMLLGMMDYLAKVHSAALKRKQHSDIK